MSNRAEKLGSVGPLRADHPGKSVKAENDSGHDASQICSGPSKTRLRISCEEEGSLLTNRNPTSAVSPCATLATDIECQTIIRPVYGNCHL